MCIESDKLWELSLDKIIKDFTGSKARKGMFNLCHWLIVFQVDNMFDFSSECLSLRNFYKTMILIF